MNDRPENCISIEHVAIDLTGGIGTVVRELANEQVNSGYEVSITLSYGEAKDVGDITVRAPKRMVTFPGRHMIMGVPDSKLSFDEENKRRVVHYHGFASIGAFRKPISNAVELCTLHGIGPSSIYSKGVDYLVRRILNRKGLRLVAVDKGTADFFSEYTNKAISVISNGLPDVHLDGKIIGEPLTFGFIGVLDELKGADVLFEAIKRGFASEVFRDERFVFVGDDNTAIGEEIKKGLLANEVLSSHVQLLGVIPDAGINIVPKMDVIVLPSETEGLPMVLLEALRAGKAVVATKVGGIPDIIQSGKNGLFTTRDPEVLLETLARISSDAKISSAMGEESRRIYNERFTSERMKMLYEKEYYLALSEKGAK